MKLEDLFGASNAGRCKLSHQVLADFAEPLAGLYGWADAAEVLARLGDDKRSALLLLYFRLKQRELWSCVRSIENVYGTGGVGAAFRSDPELLQLLRRNRRFTRLFARHGRAGIGFFEKRRRGPALHLLSQATEITRWTVHFDRYAPVGSLSGLVAHLLVEKFRGMRPDWKDILVAMQKEGLSHPREVTVQEPLDQEENRTDG